jgi:hypothetical protein
MPVWNAIFQLPDLSVFCVYQHGLQLSETLSQNRVFSKTPLVLVFYYSSRKVIHTTIQRHWPSRTTCIPKYMLQGLISPGSLPPGLCPAAAWYGTVCAEPWLETSVLTENQLTLNNNARARMDRRYPLPWKSTWRKRNLPLILLHI